MACCGSKCSDSVPAASSELELERETQIHFECLECLQWWWVAQKRMAVCLQEVR